MDRRARRLLGCLGIAPLGLLLLSALEVEPFAAPETTPAVAIAQPRLLDLVPGERPLVLTDVVWRPTSLTMATGFNAAPGSSRPVEVAEVPARDVDSEWPAPRPTLFDPPELPPDDGPHEAAIVEPLPVLDGEQRGAGVLRLPSVDGKISRPVRLPSVTLAPEPLPAIAPERTRPASERSTERLVRLPVVTLVPERLPEVAPLEGLAERGPSAFEAKSVESEPIEWPLAVPLVPSRTAEVEPDFVGESSDEVDSSFAEASPPSVEPTFEILRLPLAGEPMPPEAQAPLTRPVPSRQNGPAMHAVSNRSAEHVREGFRLARGGAYYSARSEFIRALRMISQALDASEGTMERSQALAAGLRALDESDDFAPRGARLEADLDIAILIPAHRTPVLKGADHDELSALVARQRYYTYAQQQLAVAGGGERAGSMALYGLGKVHAALISQKFGGNSTDGPKAMAFHQAALLSNADNYMAANELGVMLARFGELHSARRLLLHSVSLQPQADVWHNLAVVHERLGETSLAHAARQEAIMLVRSSQSAQGDQNTGRLNVVWTDPATFARSSTSTAVASAQASGPARQK